MMDSDKLDRVFLSDKRRSHCALGWTSGQTYLIKLEEVGDEHLPMFYFFPEYLVLVQLLKATPLLSYSLKAGSFSSGPKGTGLQAHYLQCSLGRLV